MLKLILKKTLLYLGLIVVREKTVRKLIKGTYSDAIYSNKLQPIFMINGKDTVDFFAYSFYERYTHPYTKLIKQYKKDSNLKYNNSVLYQYYNKFIPKSTCDIFKINSEINFNDYLEEHLLPWDSEPKKTYNNRSLYCGPSNDKNGKYEFQRIIDVYNSIKEKSYIVKKSTNLFDSNHIQGYFLQNNDQYRFIVLNGKHRIASLINLEYKEIPVTFRLDKPRVINLFDIENWPQVKNNTYTKEDAKKIFFYFFDNSKLDTLSYLKEIN